MAGSSDKPVAPDILSHAEKVEFDEIVRRLEEIGLASASDVGVIALAARRATEIITLTAEIEAHGYTYETVSESGRMIKANPAVRMRSEAMRHLHSLESNLGLTPLDRLRVPAKKKEPTANPFAGIGGRRGA